MIHESNIRRLEDMIEQLYDKKGVDDEKRKQLIRSLKYDLYRMREEKQEEMITRFNNTAFVLLVGGLLIGFFLGVMV